MLDYLLPTLLAVAASLALVSCGPASSSAVRHNDGVPIYSLSSGYSSGFSSAPC